jgi:hypothetical protein
MQLIFRFLILLVISVSASIGCAQSEEKAVPSNGKVGERAAEATNKTEDGQPIMGR